MFPTSNRNGPFFNDIIYTTTPHFSKQQEDPAAPFCFFHMPSPYNIPYHQELELQDSDDLLLFQQDHQQQQQQQPLELKNINDNNVKQHQDQEPNSQKIPVREPKRSSCKRDRHSKINTAQGPRNRRMRLSLKVARDFFDLQDQLGFDKASKTVEWLLFQAKPEIMKIFGNHGIDSTTTSTHKINSNNTSTTAAAAASSASDCEAAAAAASVVSVPIQQYSCPKDKPKRTRMSRKKSVLFDPVARECLREKARAWARERTREKIKNRIMVEVAANHELTITSTSSSTPSFETGTGGSAHWEESAGMSHRSNMILQQQLEHESGASEELNIDEDESLMMMLMMHNHHLYNLIPQDQVNKLPNFNLTT